MSKKNKSEQCKLLREYVREYKKKAGCYTCGSKEFLVFHHVKNRKGKKPTIFKLCNRGVSLQILMKEIEDCIVVCVKCHVEIHNRRRLMIKVNNI